MIEYADYDYYSKTYKGSLSDSLFNSLIYKASREIDKSINKETLTKEEVTDKVKYVACELVDFLNRNDIDNSSKKLSSVSIDGVSKKYTIASRSELEREKANILNGLPHNLIRFL